MRLLELFAGTGSVGRAFRRMHPRAEVVSVDINPKSHATHTVDVMKFKYDDYPPTHFDAVWASPPCVAYSNMRLVWLGRKLRDGTVLTRQQLERDMKRSDRLVRRTLKIIAYFTPDPRDRRRFRFQWFMENPRTGRLKTRPVVRGLPYIDVDYCMFARWGYRKPTRLWCDPRSAARLADRTCNKRCANIDPRTGRHKLGACTDEKRKTRLYRIPSALVAYVFGR